MKDKKNISKTYTRDTKEIEKALDGNQEGYTKLVSFYQDMLLSYIMGYTTDEEEAKDIRQDTFGKAFINLKAYDSNFAFSTWLYNIAHNNVIDYFRKTKNANRADGNNDLENIYTTNNYTPEDKIISSQEISRLVKTIESLDTKYREIAILRFIKDYAYEEIAKELVMPINTVRTRIKRAREILLTNKE